MHSIHDWQEKIKLLFKINIEFIATLVIIIFVGISSFFLGKISQNKLDNDNIYIVKSGIGDRAIDQKANAIIPIKDYIKTDSLNTQELKDPKTPQNAVYVASSRGKLYYRIGCGGSVKLSQTNKIFFSTKEQAETKGYKPAKNCAP